MFWRSLDLYAPLCVECVPEPVTFPLLLDFSSFALSLSVPSSLSAATVRILRVLLLLSGLFPFSDNHPHVPTSLFCGLSYRFLHGLTKLTGKGGRGGMGEEEGEKYSRTVRFPLHHVSMSLQSVPSRPKPRNQQSETIVFRFSVRQAFPCLPSLSLVSWTGSRRCPSPRFCYTRAVPNLTS